MGIFNNDSAQSLAQTSQLEGWANSDACLFVCGLNVVSSWVSLVLAPKYVKFICIFKWIEQSSITRYPDNFSSSSIKQIFLDERVIPAIFSDLGKTKTNFCLCVWPRLRPKVLIDLDEITFTDSWAQSLGRVPKWVKSLKPFQNVRPF